MIEPGILDLAHSKGIKFLSDMNGDGNIDKTDLSLALKAKTVGSAAAASATVAPVKQFNGLFGACTEQGLDYYRWRCTCELSAQQIE